MAELSGDDKMTAVLSYLWVLIFIPYFTTQGKRTQFQLFHLHQGMAFLCAWVVLIVVQFILMFVPVLGWLINFLLWVGYMVVGIVAIIKGLNGEMWEMPVIGKFASKFTFQ